MFGISFEHILIVGVILLLVGPKRLPELGNTFGKALKNFKDSIGGIQEATYKSVSETKPEQTATNKPATAAAPIPTLVSTPVTAETGPTGAANFEAAQTEHDPKPKSSV